MLKRPIKLYVLTVVMCLAMVQEGAAQVAVWDGDADPGLVEVQFGSSGTEVTMNVSDMVESVTFSCAGNFDIVAGGGTPTLSGTNTNASGAGSLLQPVVNVDRARMSTSNHPSTGKRSAAVDSFL